MKSKVKWTFVWVLDMSFFSSFVNLGMFLNLTSPQFLHLKYGHSSSSLSGVARRIRQRSTCKELYTRFGILWAFSRHSVQFISVAQPCLTLCDPMNCSTPGLPVHHQLPEFTQTHVHWVSDAIQPSHPLSSPSPPAPSPSQHQGLFQWVKPSHEVAKVLEFQL